MAIIFWVITLGSLLAAFIFVSVTFSVFPEVATSPWTSDDLVKGLAGVAGAFLGGVLALILFLASIVRA